MRLSIDRIVVWTAFVLLWMCGGHALANDRDENGIHGESSVPEQDGDRKTESRFEDRQRELQDLEEQFAVARKAISDEVLKSFEEEIEVYDGRAYKKAGRNFPWELKCSSVDYRTVHGCLELRFFDPSARVYFDTGNDDENELDIFNNGNLNLTVDLASIYLPWRLGKSEFFDDWSWGPVVGAGIGASARDSEDGTIEASDAPVVLLSAGGLLEHKRESGVSFGFEAGYSIGFSSDESLGDTDDSALYVGLRINVPLGERQEPKKKKTGNGN